jgi:predicted O-methyltransferase YrrM
VTRPTERQTLLNKELVTNMLRSLTPLGHHGCSVEKGIDQCDLGLGLIYYALTRVLKPRKVVVVGSLRGFSVVCIALALEDNDLGEIDFIDAAKVDDFWTDKQTVQQHFAKFHVRHRVNVNVMTTAAYLAERGQAAASVDLLFIDGDHTKEAVRFDHEGLGRLVIPGGYMAFHDSYAAGVGFTEWEVADYLGSLHQSLYEIFTLEVGQGLTILRKLPIDPDQHELLLSDSGGLWHLANSLIAEEGDGRSDIQRLASLTLKALQQARERDRVYQTRLQFLTKANNDLRKELKKLRKLTNDRS